MNVAQVVKDYGKKERVLFIITRSDLVDYINTIEELTMDDQDIDLICRRIERDLDFVDVLERIFDEC